MNGYLYVKIRVIICSYVSYKWGSTHSSFFIVCWLLLHAIMYSADIKVLFPYNLALKAGYYIIADDRRAAEIVQPNDRCRSLTIAGKCLHKIAINRSGSLVINSDRERLYSNQP